MLRALHNLRFRLFDLATILDLPTLEFRRLIDELVARGWQRTGEYDGVNAWLDYGCVKLRRGGVKLKLEWDNWNEGSIEGPREIVEGLGRDFGRPVVYFSRWSD